MRAPTPPPARPFREAWTKEVCAAYIASEQQAPDGQSPEWSAWHQTQCEPNMDALNRALVGHIKHLAQTGPLALPEGADRVDVPWLAAWRAIGQAQGQDTPYESWVTQPMEMALLMQLARLIREHAPEAPASEAAIALVHDTVARGVEAGSFHITVSEGVDCAITGERIVPSFKDWQPVLYRPVWEERTLRMEPLAQADLWQPRLEHVTVEIPSGEVWLCDWFRIPAFTALCQAAMKGQPSKPSISSEQGRVRQTQCYAEQLGFVSVYSGNSSPSVMLMDGRVVVGCSGWDDEADCDVPLPAKERGTVCTDLWQSTLIDKQHLIDLVAQAMPREEAMEAVAEWEREQSDNGALTRLQLEPGTYHLYFAGQMETFQQHFATEELELPQFEGHWVLSPTPLTPKVQPVASRKPRR